MDADLAALVVVVVIALAFDFTNGFHDAANAIATSVSTRALTPRAALALAASMNFVGAAMGTGVAKTVGAGIIATPTGSHGLTVVFAALIGAICWNLLTWWLGLPTSSSHALIGGLVGAALAAASGVHWDGVLTKIVLPMILSPLLGVALGYLMHTAILWMFRRTTPSKTSRGFRMAQSLSAAAMGLGHGLQDAQKTMGVIVLALVTAGQQDTFDVPWWVIGSVAAALAAGTYAGGWRIIRTLGRRIVHLDPPRGFAAEAAAASVLYTTAFVWHAPISTTHTITSAILGAGATRRLSAVRWGVARNIGVAWLLTMPGAGLAAAAAYALTHVLLGT
ncbi:inorganic phosphate transporter [Streptomyces enissocaesilis]|uniref:inorganic phosphate transporter n=1 Tax=Streptomyces TaxID=1883 RepID=UPI0003D7F3A9|nr:inorganic phosphate transporter [Streptomyces sp. F8]AHE39915.1 Phosphate transporter [Streptomyces sp. F8]WDI21713.1 inorganic phosphate transporter [Streptomyces enissocaesilis]